MIVMPSKTTGERKHHARLSQVLTDEFPPRGDYFLRDGRQDDLPDQLRSRAPRSSRGAGVRYPTRPTRMTSATTGITCSSTKAWSWRSHRGCTSDVSPAPLDVHRRTAAGCTATQSFWKRSPMLTIPGTRRCFSGRAARTIQMPSIRKPSRSMIRGSAGRRPSSDNMRGAERPGESPASLTIR